MTQADPPSAEHPLVGQTIASKYRILRLLGEGGMGCVYQGEQMLGTTARKVAVKTLHQHLSKDESVKARFRREVGTVAALEHPNTIQIYDFGEMDDGTLYIVMEFVQGRSVADILEKDGPMPPDRVQNILRQVVGSLEEAHGHGIVHRDLKPDNVVLAERAGQKDWVEVLDFGIAKRSSEHDPNEAKLTQQGMVLGTPPYMSPEQFTGLPIDTRSDVYALGVMAYEMLSGKLPWEANTAWEWASKHMTEAPTPIERQPLGAHIPQHMRDAIANALVKDKDRRFPSVRAFFDAFSSGGIPSAMGTGPSLAQQAQMQPGAPGTAMMGASPGAPHQPSHAPHQPIRTEMGAAAQTPTGGMMGAPPSMGPGMNQGNPGMNPYGPPPAQAMPQGMVTGDSAGQKKGSPIVFFALGGLALLLLVGAGIALLLGHKSTTAGGPLDLGGTTPSAAASTAAPTETVATAATPLSGTPVANLAGKPPGTKPTTKPATPTPPPPKVEPIPCGRARDARNMKPVQPAVVRNLEQQCRDQGGTP